MNIESQSQCGFFITHSTTNKRYLDSKKGLAMTNTLKIAPLNDDAIYQIWQAGFSQPQPEWKKLDGPYFENYQPFIDFEAFKQSDYFRFFKREDVQGIFLNGEAIGIVSRHWENEKTQWLEIGIVLYRSTSWGQNIGTQALAIWIDQIFQMYPKLQHIGLTTWSGNQRMMKAAQKLGMKEEARIRQVRYWQGVYYDSMKYGVLRQEWETIRDQYPVSSDR